MEAVLENEFLMFIIMVLVSTFPFMIVGHQYKKYGFLQGFFSLLTVPMMFLGVGELLLLMFKNNADFSSLIMIAISPLNSVYELYYMLFYMTKIEWLYDTGWIYMPAIVIFILTYGYSITFYRKKRKNRGNSE